jgi:hypothetical protein
VDPIHDAQEGGVVITWLLRKLFLVKEIVSQKGVLHFQRFRLLSLPWFSIYVHRILASDEDAHFHDHPWDFVSLILWGAYSEVWVKSPHWSLPRTRLAKPGTLIWHHHSDAHKLTLKSKVVWTLVLTGPHKYDWGYQTENGWVDHWMYRQRKRSGML